MLFKNTVKGSCPYAPLDDALRYTKYLHSFGIAQQCVSGILYCKIYVYIDYQGIQCTGCNQIFTTISVS